MADGGAVGRRSFLALAGALGIGGAARAADGPPGLPLRIVNPSGGLTTVFEELLKEQGYFAAFGVDAQTVNVSDGSKIIAALVSNNGDLCGGGGFSSLLPAIEKGARIKILAGALLAPILCVYSRRPDIRSARDLVGKSVGVGAPGALLHELMVALLIAKGVDYTKVNFVNVGSGQNVFRAVVAGTVDAGPGDIDFYARQAQYGVHTLSDGELWKELPQYANQAIFASERAIADKRDTLVRALAAYARLYRFTAMANSRDVWIKARAIAMGKDSPEEAEAQWRFFQSPGRLATNLILDPQKIDYVQTLNLKLGVQNRMLPLSQVADMSLARDALKLLS